MGVFEHGIVHRMDIENLENSMIVTGASGFPIIGSSSAEIFTGSDG